MRASSLQFSSRARGALVVHAALGATLVTCALGLVACGTSSDADPAANAASASDASAPLTDAATSRASAAASCGDAATCDAGGSSARGPSADGGATLLAIFSAFPAEMAPLVARANVTSTIVVDGHTVRLGTLGGVRVAMTLTGMGLTSAAATAKSVLDKVPATGVVFSGVAGSKLRIGDVVVPETWSLRGTSAFAPAASWLTIARALTSSGAACFEHCTVVPATGAPVCMDHGPGLAFGGAGRSDDTSVPVSCNQSTDDVFGCDVSAPAGPSEACAAASAVPASADLDAGGEPVVTDNETAAVAAEASARGLPFIAFRGVSDGAGDPLRLPGYPAEFFAYYRLAARNAAAATAAFVSAIASAP